MDIKQEELKYLTTLNDINTEEGFHMCNIFMVALIDDLRASQIQNHDQHKCQEWEWIPYSDYV